MGRLNNSIEIGEFFSEELLGLKGVRKLEGVCSYCTFKEVRVGGFSVLGKLPSILTWVVKHGETFGYAPTRANSKSNSSTSNPHARISIFVLKHLI